MHVCSYIKKHDTDVWMTHNHEKEGQTKGSLDGRRDQRYRRQSDTER